MFVRARKIASRVMEGVVAIQILAAGMDGTESINVVVDEVVVATWSDIGGDAESGVFDSFQLNLPLQDFPASIQLEFTNDDWPRDVRIDRIVVNGVDYQAESPGVFSTGTWTSEGCVPGFHESEWLHCNGYLQFDLVDPDEGTELILEVAGVSGEEALQVIVDDDVVARWDRVGGDAESGNFISSVMMLPGAVEASSVRIAFFNDDIGNDLRLRQIVLDGVEYPTASTNVFSTGTWTGNGCDPGFHGSQWLHCNGYFHFARNLEGELPATLGQASINGDWSTIDGIRNFRSPVGIVGPASLNDLTPGIVQWDELPGSSFASLRFREWSEGDETPHADEVAGWIMMEQGRFTTADGSSWEAGRVRYTGLAAWQWVRFSTPFSEPPAVFATVQNNLHESGVIARVRHIDRTGFEIALFGPEGSTLEGSEQWTAGYLAANTAAQSGVAAIGGEAVPYSLSTVEPGVSSELTSIDNRLSLLAGEDQFMDAEVVHPAEPVAVLRLGEIVFAQDFQFVDPDPFSLRMEILPGGIELPEGFLLTQILAGSQLEDAVAIDIAADGRIFIAEEKGVIRVVENGILQPEPYLDPGSEVYSAFADEGALSGFALDPDFASNGHFYLLYSTRHRGTIFGRLSRYTQDRKNPARARTSSRKILVGSRPADGLIHDVFHNVGDIEFGHDGSLFFSWGDTAGNAVDDPRQFRSQEPSSAAGKIFRIDPRTGNGYNSNPFFNGRLRSVESRTWATGLRNGFRFEVVPDPENGDGGPGRLYIADVGRYEYEEINTAIGGENFGWPLFEGRQPFRPYDKKIVHTPPIVEIDHSQARSVIAGDFCRSTQWPMEYQGGLFVADFVEGWIRAWRPGNSHTSLSEVPFAAGLKGITDMKFDTATGRMMIIGRGKDIIFTDGTGLDGLYSIEYVPPDLEGN